MLRFRGNTLFFGGARLSCTKKIFAELFFSLLFIVFFIICSLIVSRFVHWLFIDVSLKLHQCVQWFFNHSSISAGDWKTGGFRQEAYLAQQVSYMHVFESPFSNRKRRIVDCFFVHEWRKAKKKSHEVNLPLYLFLTRVWILKKELIIQFSRSSRNLARTSRSQGVIKSIPQGIGEWKMIRDLGEQVSWVINGRCHRNR